MPLPSDVAGPRQIEFKVDIPHVALEVLVHSLQAGKKSAKKNLLRGHQMVPNHLVAGEPQA